MIVRLPLGRLSEGAERFVLRSGALRSTSHSPLRVVDPTSDPPRFCAACAAPIEFGAVRRAEDEFCSVECSLGGDRPA